MIERKLSGVFVRIERGGKWVNMDFADLTEDEMKTFLAKKDTAWITGLAVILACTIRELGDEFNIIAEAEEA
jgi:hypothetical protein